MGIHGQVIAGKEAEPTPRMSIMRNMVNPIHRPSFQNNGRRQATRKGRCWWSLGETSPKVRDVLLPSAPGTHAPGRFRPGYRPVQTHGTQEITQVREIAQQQGWLAPAVALPDDATLAAVFTRQRDLSPRCVSTLEP